MHDAPSSTYMPYCFAYDLSRLATEGLFFIDNYNNEPPKHLQTFLDDVIESVEYEEHIDHKNYLYVGIEVGNPTVDDIVR